MTPYPLIYTPPGIDKPACCPHPGCAKIMPGRGPDCTVGLEPARQVDGCCWGGILTDSPSLVWLKVKAGWWLGLEGHQPQHLSRLRTHPSIRRWRTIEGATPEHHWRIPVLLEVTGDGKDTWYVSALDGHWNGVDFVDPPEFEELQTRLLSIAHKRDVHADLAERNRLILDLVLRLLAIGHWVDDAGDLVAAAKWLSESMMQRVVLAALDFEPKAPA